MELKKGYDTKIEQLQREIGEKEEDIHDLNEIIETKDKDMAQIEEEIDQYQQDIQEKENLIIELKNQQAI